MSKKIITININGILKFIKYFVIDIDSFLVVRVVIESILLIFIVGKNFSSQFVVEARVVKILRVVIVIENLNFSFEAILVI